jgi:hypothetical protein
VARLTCAHVSVRQAAAEAFPAAPADYTPVRARAQQRSPASSRATDAVLRLEQVTRRLAVGGCRSAAKSAQLFARDRINALRWARQKHCSGSASGPVTYKLHFMWLAQGRRCKWRASPPRFGAGVAISASGGKRRSVPSAATLEHRSLRVGCPQLLPTCAQHHRNSWKLHCAALC